MEFTCPHCGKTFEQKTRKASTSERANAARKRNGALGGGQRKASPDALAKVYAKRKEWTWQDFVGAVKKETGIVYSRAQAYQVLKKLKVVPTGAWVDATGKKVLSAKELRSLAKKAGEGGFEPAANAVMSDDAGLDPAIKDMLPLVKNNKGAAKSIPARASDKKVAK